ncbi:hypothetical protein RHDE110596_21450 [Prescottella defluvii]|uniref:hypothetical protein n=1 Tax=Prescottella defluvii TaxID=1323361 RepID=UPI000566AAD4|nr:hypothetical protein [Prescottella defluvii]
MERSGADNAGNAESAEQEDDVVRPADVPEADLVEQMTPAAGDEDREDSDRSEPPLEVNEADAAEQRRSVPVDEDYPRG